MNDWQTITINEKNYSIKLKDIERLFKKLSCQNNGSHHRGTDAPVFYLANNGKLVSELEIPTEQDKKNCVIRLITDKIYPCKNIAGSSFDEDFFKKQREELEKAIVAAERENRCSFEVENIGYICLSNVGLCFVAFVCNKAYAGYDERINLPQKIRKSQLDEDTRALVVEIQDRIRSIKNELQARKRRFNLEKMRKEFCKLELYNESKEGRMVVHAKKDNSTETEIDTVEGVIDYLDSNKYLK